MIEIAKKDIVARLEFDNPWWDAVQEREIAFEKTPRRMYFDAFYNTLTNIEISRAVVLMGPRRVGKTVMIYHAVKRLLSSGAAPTTILYLSLETPIYTGLSLEQIVNMFRERNQHSRDSHAYIFFDEIQYLKDWEVHLKSLVDSYPSYRFVATGSAAAALRMKSNESGAGRFSDFALPPLTFAEYLSFVGKTEQLIQPHSDLTSGTVTSERATDIAALNKEFVNYLNFGGYPEAVFSETVRKDPAQHIKSDIIDKVLLRDLPSLYGISDIQELNRLFTTIAYNTGNEVSLEKLSKSSGVVKNTLKRYLEYLEAAFLIRRVERIDNNAKRFKRATAFKVYLTNPSMRAALFGQVDANAESMGALTETAVFSQWAHSSDAMLCYARWGDREIDLVCLSRANQKPRWAVEIKWSDRATTKSSELENCVIFAKAHPQLKQPILITTRTERITSRTINEVNFVFQPASEYVYMLGKNLLLSKQPNEV
jgi:uncharacterized protein